MLKCKDIAHQASQYVDSTLPCHKKVGWYMHLAMCHNCRRFIKQFKLTLAYASRLSKLPTAQASSDEVTQIMHNIKNNNPKP